VAVFSFSLADTYDTIGTFIGSATNSLIFSKEDFQTLNQPGANMSKLGRAISADAWATAPGALLGTSSVTTFITSLSGVLAGGKTGLVGVFFSGLFALCIFFTPWASMVPSLATAPALIVVGVMMMGSIKRIEWERLEIAVPAFFAAVFMTFCFDIANGIGIAFIIHCVIRIAQGQAREISPVMGISSVLFLINYAVLALF
jgi:AGZA family xanthine/uracil permease-like MFS transporter